MREGDTGVDVIVTSVTTSLLGNLLCAIRSSAEVSPFKTFRDIPLIPGSSFSGSRVRGWKNDEVFVLHSGGSYPTSDANPESCAGASN